MPHVPFKKVYTCMYCEAEVAEDELTKGMIFFEHGYVIKTGGDEQLKISGFFCKGDCLKNYVKDNI